MKTFKDLEFKNHSAYGKNGKQARMTFDNGYGISVVRFKILGDIYGSYTADDTEWECGITYGKNEHWRIVYDSGLTDDVIGHLKEEEVTELMDKIQKLEPKKDETN